MAYAMGDYVIPENAEVVTNPPLREGEEAKSFVWVRMDKMRGNTLGAALQLKKPPGSMAMRFVNGFPEALIELPRGVHSVVKPAECPPYSSLHPRSISLASCENDEAAASIAFSIGQDLALNFELLQSKGYIESMPVPLYHAHVLWCYAIRIDRGKGDAYALSIVSARSHLLHRDDFDCKRYFDDSNPPGLVAPPVTDVSLHFVNASGEQHSVELKPAGDDFHATRQFTKQELLDLAVDGKLKMSVHMCVDRAYFSLLSIIDLDKKPPTVSAATRDIVETILCGGKPAGYDWEITGVSRSRASISYVYYVHKAAFTRLSEPIAVACRGEYTASVVLVNGGERCTLTGFNDDDIERAIRIAYGVEVPLLGISDRPLEFIQSCMGYLLKDTFRNVVVPQWEREICRRALAFDLLNPSSCMVDLLHFLNVIWEAPIGHFPVAERVCIGVFADMVHLNARGSEELFLKETVSSRLAESCIATKHVKQIVQFMQLLLHSMKRVRKTAVVFEEGDSESDDVQDSDSSADVDSDDYTSGSDVDGEGKEKDTVGSTVEQVDQREDWYDVESGGVETEDKWTCAIS